MPLHNFGSQFWVLLLLSSPKVDCPEVEHCEAPLMVNDEEMLVIMRDTHLCNNATNLGKFKVLAREWERIRTNCAAPAVL